MRNNLPRRSLVFAALRCASNAGFRVARSSIGEYPSEANGFVSSPVVRYRLPAASKSMSPPTWQQIPRLVGTSSTVTWLARFNEKSVLRVNRDSRLTPFQAEKSVPSLGASPAGVDSGGA